MFNLVVLLLVAPLLVSAKFYSSEDKREEWERIVGGTKAPNGSAPYQVSVLEFGFGMRPQFMRAVVGTNQLRAGGKSYSVRKIVSHEEYDGDVIINDIAIVFTDKEIQFSDNVDAVELNDEPVEAGEELLLTGWGTTSYPGRVPNDLMQLQLRAVSYEDCKAAHESVNAVFETQICAITKEGGGACHGDSGGPLVREGRQVGVVSWGVPCAKGKPDVYTSVHSFMPWIEKTLLADDEEHLLFLNNRTRIRQINRHRSLLYTNVL